MEKNNNDHGTSNSIVMAPQRSSKEESKEREQNTEETIMREEIMIGENQQDHREDGQEQKNGKEQFLALTNDQLVLRRVPRNKIRKVMITQPNYSRYGKRSWKMPHYGLALLNACIKEHFDSEMFDPDYRSLSDDQVFSILKEKQPDVVCIGTISTEFYETTANMTRIIREALPHA